jgi:hypothetical protein
MDWKTENRKDGSLRRRLDLNAFDVGWADGDKAAVAAIEANNAQLAELKERLAALVQGRDALTDHRVWFDRDCIQIVRCRQESLHATWDCYVALRRFLEKRLAVLDPLGTTARGRLTVCEERRASAQGRVSCEYAADRRAMMDLYPGRGDQVFESFVNKHRDVAAAHQACVPAKARLDAIMFADREVRDVLGLVETRLAELFVLVAA